MENKESKDLNKFVVVPNEVVDCKEISPKSLVVYCAIRQHMNWETLEAFPSIATIAKEAGCGTDMVRKAIKELVDNKFISLITRKGQSTIYKFSSKKKFEPFSYDFLKDDKIKIREKAYLIMQQKNIKLDEYTGIGSVSYSTKEISEMVRMSVPTVLSCENKLLKAGYLVKPESKVIDKETGLHKELRMYLLELYNMAKITYNQTQKNTEDIEENKKQIDQLIKQNESMKKEIEILKRLVFKEEEIPEIII